MKTNDGEMGTWLVILRAFLWLRLLMLRLVITCDQLRHDDNPSKKPKRETGDPSSADDGVEDFLHSRVKR